MRMEGIEEEVGLDNETIVRKIAKKGKRILRKDGVGQSVRAELVIGSMSWLGPN